MARELTYTIQVLSEQAEAKVRRMEQAFKDATKAAGTQGFAKAERDLERATTAAEKAQDKLAVAIARQKDAIAGADKQTASMIGTLQKFGQMVGIAFGVQQIIAFGQALASSADQLTKLNARTDLSYQTLQRWDIAASDAGNTIEQLGDATNKMQARLAGGNESFLGALQQVGIAFEDFRALGPEQQMYALSDALRTVRDPAEQVRLATAFFGPLGQEILPTLKRGFDDVRDAQVGMRDDVVEAWDESADTLNRWWATFQGIAANVIVDGVRLAEDGFNPALERLDEMERLLEAINGQLDKMVRTAVRPDLFKQSLPSELNLSGRGVPQFAVPAGADRWAAEQDAAIKRQIAQAEAAREALARLRAQAAEINAAMGSGFDNRPNMTQPLVEYHAALQRISDLVQQGAATYQSQLATSITNVKLETERLVGREGPLPAYQKRLGELVEASNRAQKANRGIGDSLRSLFKGDFKTVMGDVGGFLKGGLQNIGQGLLQGLGQGVFGMVSSLAGMGLSALGRGVGRLFGMTEERQVNPIRQSFIDAAGGLAALNQRAVEATGSLDLVHRLLDAKTVKDYEAAVKSLTDAFEFQDRAMQTLDETIAKYGFRLEDLSPVLQLRALTKIAGEIYQDIRVLLAGGLDQATILANEGIQKALNDLVRKAISTGQALPEQLRPFIEELIRMGKLTDEAGNLITDIGRIQFSRTLEQQIGNLIEKIERLVDAITGKLYPAITNIPPLPTDPVENIPGKPDLPRMPDAMHEGGVVRAHSGMLLGPKEVPIIALEGERILNPRETRAYHAGQRSVEGGGRGSVTVTVDARGAWLDGQGVDQIAKRIRESLSRGGPEQTAWRGALRMGV